MSEQCCRCGGGSTYKLLGGDEWICVKCAKPGEAVEYEGDIPTMPSDQNEAVEDEAGPLPPCYLCGKIMDMCKANILETGEAICLGCAKKRPTKQNEAEQRKKPPVFSGVMKYFPDALLELARCSVAGNEQHNPGTPLHWDRNKSGNDLDALVGHLLKVGTFDDDGIRHSAKVFWRAGANLQREIENDLLKEGQEVPCVTHFPKLFNAEGQDYADEETEPT